MSQPLLVIVSGLPCSGKTTLARRLAKELALPLIAKDDIKESLFDSLGWSDREWSKRLGRATYPLLFYFVETQLSAGRSLIVESNFDPHFATETFLALRRKFLFEPFQIQRQADGPVLVERFKERAESGARHPGHVDHLTYDEMRQVLLNGKYDKLDIGGTVVEIDTTGFQRIDYTGLVRAIRLCLQ
jgi:predicted kinase